MDLLTRQPFKAIWTLFAVTVNAIQLPFWILYYFPRFFRPNPKWTLNQAVRVHVLRAFLYHASVVEMKIPMLLDPGKEGHQYVVMDRAEEKLYTGVASQDPAITPGKVGGTWYPSTRTSGEKAGLVVLHFHGGAFVLGDGRKEDTGFLAKTLLANTQASHVFCPQYRLANSAGGRFPGHLQDAITSYSHLVNRLGIDPSQIIISGDSAGGNIAIALLRYIADHGKQVGFTSAGCAWLWSPWVDIVASYFDSAAMDKNPNRSTDYVPGPFGAWGARRVAPAPSSGLSIAHPYLNCLENAFATDTPIFISTGECEVLMREDIKLYEQMSKVEGNQVELQIEENAIHDIILTGALSGFEKEAEYAAKRAGEFLTKHTSAKR